MTISIATLGKAGSGASGQNSSVSVTSQNANAGYQGDNQQASAATINAANTADVTFIAAKNTATGTQPSATKDPSASQAEREQLYNSAQGSPVAGSGNMALETADGPTQKIGSGLAPCPDFKG